MYYPKSKIKENQYTSGNDLVIALTQVPYKGKYYATFDGRYFTGNTGESTSVELLKIVPTGNTDVNRNAVYFNPIPSSDDYRIGFIKRYFIKRVNSGTDTIKEISLNDYQKFLINPLYTGTIINWKLTGPLYDDKSSIIMIPGIIDTNSRVVHNAEKLVPGLSNYLINLAEFSNKNL